jgi:FkbM family methyltransferase
MGAANAVKKAMYKAMPLEKYLRTVSGAYFLIYRLGFGRLFKTYEYPRFLKNLVKPGDVVIDIGANLGYYSWFFSRLAGAPGRVYAVEPVKPIFDTLSRNMRGRKNVKLYNYALGGQEREVTIGNDSVRGQEHFATGRNFVLDAEATGRSGAENEFSASMRRGSELFGGLERVDLIKCDIEGYESVVIPEMEPVIDKYLPVVLLESEGETRRMLSKFFADKGYRAFVLRGGKMAAAAPDDTKDLILVPGDRLAGFESRGLLE